MKTSTIGLKIVLLSGILFIVAQSSSSGKIRLSGGGPGKKPPSAVNDQHSPPSFPAAIERQLNFIEAQIVNAAEAMPEDKFYFTPESLGLKGSEFKGVRTFAGQIKHLATDNFDIWRSITGDPLPEGIKDVNGPENIKTKAEIMQFLKASFALGHKAIMTMNEKNAIDMLPFRGGSLPRLDLAFYALTHANEHYGQMVVYLRMCGIIPPGGTPVKK